MARRFNSQQRVALYLASGGRCALCGVELEPGWHADHIAPWARGGETDVVNGQALCPTCNLKKGDGMATETKAQTAITPRAWQTEAWNLYEAKNGRDFLCCSTPGAGKTLWAKQQAVRLLQRGAVKRVVVVAPTQEVRDQWARKDIPGLKLEASEHTSNANGGREHSADFQGCVLTYAQVAKQPDLQRMACGQRDTLVIFDELHHAGCPQSWGKAMETAFEWATRRIGLTGTPWRSGKSFIPFVNYDKTTGAVTIDFNYDYGRAVRDGVCRAVQFHAYDGKAQAVELKTATSKTLTLSELSADDDDHSAAMTAILDAHNDWLPSVLRVAHQTLLDVIRGSEQEQAIPDAKGLVLANDRQHAMGAAELLRRITGENVEVIISSNAADDPGDMPPDAKAALQRFRTGKGRWAVAVDMVSEGVDIPELFVGVYASRKRTPLRFRQIVGRFVRRRSALEERDAVLFIPATPDMMALASDMQSELRHMIDLEREEYEREKRREQAALLPSAPSEPDLIFMNTSEAALAGINRLDSRYSEAEYTVALGAAHDLGLTSTDAAIRLIDVLRQRGIHLAPQTIPTSYQPDAVEASGEGVSTNSYKVTLRKQINREANAKARVLKMEYRDFHTILSRRFGKVDTLSVDELHEELDYIRNFGVEAE